MTEDRLRTLRLRQKQAQAKSQKQTVGRDPNRPIGQFNKGVVEFAGGAVDILNPFNDPVWQNTPLGTGSARDAIASGMNAIGADVATDEPEGVLQNFMRGAGEASVAVVPLVKSLQVLSRAGGSVGAFADDAINAIRSWGGVTTEMGAGGVSRAAEGAAEDAGAPEWVQNTAAVAAPMSIPAVGMAARPTIGAAAKVMERMPITGPLVGAARRIPGQVAAAVAPYTEGGARRVAGDRMTELAGGRDRAEQMADMTKAENPLNLTPAQQTGDPNFIALEQRAAAEDPNLMARLEDRAEASSRSARGAISDMGGEVEAAQSFVESRRRQFAKELTKRADREIQKATGGVQNISATRPTSENSVRVVEAINRTLADELTNERALWDAIPKVLQIQATGARAVAQDILQNTTRYKQKDIPPELRQFVEAPEEQSVGELYDLYSTLRETARNSMAGNNQQKNKARLANMLADAVLRDLGAIDGTTAIGRQINEARAFSRALHETFDQGEVGRLLNRTIDGDTTTAPELALDRTIGRGGTTAMVGDRDIEQATRGTAAPFVADFLKGRFSARAFDAEGKFTSLGAKAFLRDNSELLSRYPDLRADITDAVDTRVSADEFAARVSNRLANLRDRNRSATERFINEPPEQAFKAVLRNKNPVQAAARLVNEVKKDSTGQALAGLKGAVSEHLIANSFRVAGGRVAANADAITSILENPRAMGALRRIFPPDELARLKRIAIEMTKLQRARTPQRDIGEMVESRANRLVDYAARVVAARQGAALGGSFAGGLQSAQMASSRMREALGYLVSDRASQMLADAIEDPELFRALLTQMTPKSEKQIINRVWPYLIGTISSGDGD